MTHADAVRIANRLNDIRLALFVIEGAAIYLAIFITGVLSRGIDR